MSISAFHPLIPEERMRGPLLSLAAELVAQGHRLEAAAGQLSRTLAPLLRAMNSYYTNKIEGQQTRPADIERALHHHFDADKRQAHRQRLALAHIQVETALETTPFASRTQLYAPELVANIHSQLYLALPVNERITDDGNKLIAGKWREGLVTAGRHLAPAPAEVPALLADWQAAYSSLPGVELAVVGAVCSHHRLLWVHPFPDGNGRTARLHTHLVLRALGLTHGLWSPLRGMARNQEAYYARLNNADLPRRNDLDGRGSLSQEELVAFAAWLLEVCLDQARFMQDLLSLGSLKERLLELLQSLAARPWAIGAATSLIKVEALEALHYAAVFGPVERGRFMAMTGLPARTARRVLTSLLDYGVLEAETSRAKVNFAVPYKSLRFVFPRLWPEAEADTA
ncbi:MAG TPA: Fic family protein [Polyangiaceae bacterium]|nr:Fic family protein [Polyangiaceae bacterium]